MKKEVVKSFALGAIATIAAQKVYKALGISKYVKPVMTSLKAKVIAKLDKLCSNGEEEPKAE